MRENLLDSAPKKPLQETTPPSDTAAEVIPENNAEIGTSAEHPVFEKIGDDPDIQAMHTDVAERTNRDGQVQRARVDGRTPLGDSYQNIYERVQQREGMHAVDRFVSTNPVKAEQYASKWNTLVGEHPEIGNLPLMSFNGDDVFSWAEKNKVTLPMGLEEMSLARDFSKTIEFNRRKAGEQKRLTSARAEASKLSSDQSRIDAAEQQVGADASKLEAIRQNLGLAAPAQVSSGVRQRNDIEKLRTSVQENAASETSMGVESTETDNHFFREAPATLRDVDNAREEDAESGSVWKPEERANLEEVRDFLDTTLETARANKDESMVRDIETYKEHFSYIGEKQFDEAIEGMSRVIAQRAGQGKRVTLFPFGNRSEKFVTDKLLEKLATSPFRKNIVLERNPNVLAKRIKENPDKNIIFIPDDFVISGARLEGAAQMLTEKLVEQGLDEETAKSLITPLAVAGPDRQFKFGSKPFMYYRADAFSKHPWPAVTGFHAATDYGFRNSMERFREYMQERGVTRTLPRLTDVKKPYAA